MAEKSKKYKLIGRDHQGFDEDGARKVFVTGEMVSLTDVQYEAFKDKFEEPMVPVEQSKEPEVLKTPVKTAAELQADAEAAKAAAAAAGSKT